MTSTSHSRRLVAAWLALAPATALAQESDDVISANELAVLCKKLKSDSFEERWAAVEEIRSLGKENAHALAERLERTYTAKPENMRLVLTGLRKKLKEARIKDLEAKGKTAKVKDLPLEEPPEFLRILVERRNQNYPGGWQDAVEIMTLLVALAEMGTTEAIGDVIDYSPMHEAAFRKEIYQIVGWLGPKAVPALVRRQDAKDADVQVVVGTTLADLMMERPGQQVQLKDHALLVEVLQAFGDHKNIDALDAVISFVNSDKDQVREAAREAIRAYGQLALWTLKKEYKEQTGEMPDPEWDAARIATELFALEDAERMAPLHDRMEAGLAMAAEGRYEEMEKAFRRILAEQPFYGRRAEMVPGYVAYGDELVESRDLDRAALMFKVAERLDVDGKHADAIAARLLLTEGLRSIEEGAPDAQPLRMALERDPDLELAGRYRIMGALGIGSAAIIVLVLLVIRRLGDS
jgi:hypothetical protein